MNSDRALQNTTHHHSDTSIVRHAPYLTGNARAFSDSLAKAKQMFGFQAIKDTMLPYANEQGLDLLRSHDLVEAGDRNNERLERVPVNSFDDLRALAERLGIDIWASK